MSHAEHNEKIGRLVKYNAEKDRWVSLLEFLNVNMDGASAMRVLQTCEFTYKISPRMSRRSQKLKLLLERAGQARNSAHYSAHAGLACSFPASSHLLLFNLSA